MKSYVKLASGLMVAGAGLAALERMTAAGFSQAHLHLPAGSGVLVSAMIVVPLLLIGAGVLVYLGGAILGLK
ncbi:hypothetical protein [Pelagibacterium xiamenense]|uniref:hypothetical protein n=1 Tax=Pelagibacterium xiamenense TaxID=2901140 RepID=UPI001E401341|nr:hypothetical protein [Pelagibacterium xiamenense]MCD7060282.1 hypothetical protein [Pelagibacterium xiamenense]